MDKKPEAEIGDEYSGGIAIRYSLFLAPKYKAKFKKLLENAIPIDVFGEVGKKSLEEK